ncbi:hypothetical protein [Halanaerobaculum tunisiense]
MLQEKLLQQVAQHCSEYEPIAIAQGFGISWLNNPESLDQEACDLCINWQDGTCDIFHKHKVKY